MSRSRNTPPAKARSLEARGRNRRAPSRLAFAPAVEAGPRMVPTRYVKAFVGLLLLPVAAVFSQTFFGAFHTATVQQEFWRAEEFWFFSLGAGLWTLWFLGCLWTQGGPHPLRLYVFGHELTHAIWVWVWQGRVLKFSGWSREGGYVITDTHNFWIALAPYFYPIYSFAVVVLYAAGSLVWNFTESTATFALMTPGQWLFLLLGLTWAFHFSFTLWMIPKGQTDLTYHGTFFSLVVIYLMNVVLLAVFLIVCAPGVTARSFGSELWTNAENFSEAACQLLARLQTALR